MNNLASAYASTDRLDDALPIYKETLKLRKATLGPLHPDTLTSTGDLADTYLKIDRAEDALPLFAQFIEGNRKQAEDEDPGFAGLLASVSLDLLKHDQHVAAEKYLRECLAIRETTTPDHWLLANTQSMLGGALAGQQQYEQAEPLLTKSYEELEKRADSIPPAGKIRVTEAIQRLVDLYMAWEKPQAAAKWRTEFRKHGSQTLDTSKQEKPR
jgi:eukaryotic-like serine/threonine-protein kinase